MRKTTPDEEAYDLLKIWRNSNNESVSSLVKRVAPIPGTLGALISCIEESGTSRPPSNDELEKIVKLQPVAKHGPSEKSILLFFECKYRREKVWYDMENLQLSWQAMFGISQKCGSILPTRMKLSAKKLPKLLLETDCA